MDWLKDKKNLPIVAGLASFVLVGAIVFILFQLGVIGGSSSTADTSPAGPPVAANPVSPAPGAPGPSPAGPSPAGPPKPALASQPPKPSAHSPAAPGAHPPGPNGPPAPGVKVAAADPTIINPHVGPDPFGIPGGVRKLDALKKAANPGGLAMPLRSILPMPHLWNYQSAPPPAPPPPVNGTITVDAPTMRVSGIVNAADGIYAILEVSGQSQTVKPGDSIPGGGRVVTIQPDGVTVRTGSGQTVVVPLSAGSTAPSDNSAAPPPTDQNQ